ncbi:DUF2663 family protein [Guptibacillus hwajinpoensis]|uniref:SMODS and SLOG-associating 2TM effector domain-containing protein n=1 Tax=Guptibacillus hwajinpoensis TaxID=208199 RepID=A0A0J6CPG4_9BACL|nr:DUF2663 family protein [Alkalihalobacillus macyae]KMM38121.1 hypothetical protein AB986_02000 [Alkalihalobacillus macyae]
MDVFKQWNLPQPQSNVTIVLLQELVERKNDEKHFKAKSLFYGYVLTFLILIIGAIFLYELERSTALFVRSVSPTTTPFLSVTILMSIAAFYQLRKFNKKCKKAEDEFESLRLEVLDRSDELFEGQIQWENRDDVFKYMKETHDVNLYYK